MDIVWTGNVRDLVATVARSDARTTYVDGVTGAKIRINIDGLEGATERDEPFYIESPNGEDLYDAYNRKEAVMILSNIRKGKKFPDMPEPSKPKRSVSRKGKSKRSSSRQSSAGLRTMRR